MKISVIGCGYLGAVHAACMAELGHEVVGVDVDPAKLDALAQGRAPFFEPGLPELLSSAMATGRLKFAAAPAVDELADVDVHFIAVGTPQSAEGKAADLTYVHAAVAQVLAAIPEGASPVIVGKSTVPVGTAQKLAERIEEAGATLVWNPEFLREGFAVQDTLSPDRIVYGVSDDPHHAERGRKALDEVYAPLLEAGIPQIVTSYPTAELVKVAANSFLATKISFINAMSELCEATGGDVSDLAEAIGHDDRIGKKFLRAGVGFGGGCLPKDIRAFMARAEELGVGESVAFLHEVDAINLRRRDRVVTLAEQALGGDVSGRRVTVLGAAFKPNSDDIRDSPALDVARRLSDMGAAVTVTDPEALDNVRQVAPYLNTEDDTMAALDCADLLILLTEWKQYVELDAAEVAKRVSTPAIIDGRNALDPQTWRDAGWAYVGLGRPSPKPALVS